MHQFPIHIHSFGDIKAFVALATVQPFRVTVRHEEQQVNAKSFMEMFTLDYSEPLRLKIAEENQETFRIAAKKFIANP